MKASKDDPQYLVKSEKSGGTAVHKPSGASRRPEPVAPDGGGDLGHMKKVNAYVKQQPDKSKGELEDATWTHSLRNWGHDPLK